MPSSWEGKWTRYTTGTVIIIVKLKVLIGPDIQNLYYYFPSKSYHRLRLVVLCSRLSESPLAVIELHRLTCYDSIHSGREHQRALTASSCSNCATHVATPQKSRSVVGDSLTASCRRFYLLFAFLYLTFIVARPITLWRCAMFLTMQPVPLRPSWLATTLDNYWSCPDVLYTCHARVV